MKAEEKRRFMGDFETTVFKGQKFTEVWASAVVELGSEDVRIFHSIGDTFEYLVSLDTDLIIYYHNLKFDGNFWLSYLMTVLHYTQATDGDPQAMEDLVEFQKPSEMKNRTFLYTISDLGQWYRIMIKTHGHTIEIRDSLKLLPFSVEQIGQSFMTKHKKLEMEYEGVRYAGCEITPEEQRYIANDVLVVKEALEIMLEEGHSKLTIGSCCLDEFRQLSGPAYQRLFPDLYKMKIEEDLYEALNSLGVGILGSGGDTSVLAVNVEYAYTHIAGICVAISSNCMVARRGSYRVKADGTVEEMESPNWFNGR